MASPFAVFRKHQKILIATLGLLAMIAFVFLPIILEGLGTRSMENPVVVETKKYGDLHEWELQGMLRQRQMVINFLQRAVSMAAGQPVRSEWIEQEFGSISEESVVDTWILANRAKDLGMQVSDPIINRFIKEVTADRVTAYEVKTILKNLRITQKQLFEALRNELLARYFQQMFFPSLQGAPPAQRWDYYRRLNRRATVQLVPVSVANFVSEIPDPDEKTLLAFFEKHKKTYATPTSSEPGFHEPARVNVQYFKADHAQFVDPAQVTDEEIKLYYDQVKDRDYLDIQLPDLGEEESQPTPEEETSEKKTPPAKEQTEKADKEAPKEKGDAVKADKETSEEKKDAVKADKEAPEEKKDAVKADKEAPEEKKDAVKADKETSEEKKDAVKADKETSEEKKDAVKATGEDAAKKNTSAVETRSPMRFVSMANETPAEETGSSEGDPSPEAGQESPKKEASGSKEAQSTEPKYIPLEKVESEIRQRLAQEHATTRIEEKFGPLREKMADYHDKWILAEALKDEDPSARGKIQKLDFAVLGKENGLETEKTGLITQLEAYQLDIGKSVIDEQVPFVRFAFEGLPLYRPAISRDLEGNQYLFWKIEEIEDNVPEFEDKGVREKVLAAWKMVQARAKAREAAEKLAAKARESKKSLKDLYAGQPDMEVLEPSAFSWLTQGAVPAMSSRTPPRLSEVEGVQHPGPDFMRDVFALEDGEITVTMNQPETVAYVVQMEDLKPTTRVLWELFQADDYGKYAAAAAPDQQQVLRAWRDEIMDSAGVEWARDPIRPQVR